MSEDENEGLSHIVIDNGSYNVKVGYAGYDNPTLELRNVIGRDMEDASVIVGGDAEKYALDEKRKIDLTYPVKKGIITEDSDVLEKLYSFIFYNELKVAPEEHAIMHCVADLTPHKSLENVAKTCFETFSVPAYYHNHTGVLDVYTFGKTSGLAISCGYDSTRTSIVYEGYSLPHCT